MISKILLFLSSSAISLFITFPIVWALHLLKIGQSIRPEGPESHQAKAGTVTMGGIGVVLTIIAFSLIFINFEMDLKFLGLILLVFGFATIGLVDDLIKFFRRQNLGLTFWQKIIFQTILAAIFSLLVINLGHVEGTGDVLRSIGFAHPIFYFLLSTFIIVGTANATNLTDGLDGLLAGTAGIAFLAYAFLSSRLMVSDAVLFSTIAAGATFAFLYFNFPKSRVFMGDVGSLALGAALAGIAIIIHKELRLMVIGGVFLIEALSVILQVAWYKRFKKRIFKMAPLHHHFELSGWPEIRIVIVFWIVAVILGLIGALI